MEARRTFALTENDNIKVIKNILFDPEYQPPPVSAQYFITYSRPVLGIPENGIILPGPCDICVKDPASQCAD